MCAFLDDSAARLAAFVASSDDAIISKDLDGVITSWNAGAERLFGFTAAEAVGQPITIIIPPERHPEEELALARIRAGLGLDQHETVRRRKDGSLVDVSLTLSPVRDAITGVVVGASKIARDISDRRRMEREAQRLAAIVEFSDDAIISKNLDGIVQTWNYGAERIFGYTAGEAIGRSITLIIPEDRLQEESLVLERIRAGRSIDHFETLRRRKDGSLIEISLTVSPIRTASGTVVGVSKIARDVSEANRLRRAIEHASRLKDEFLATLSHELRTPLNTVLGYASMLRKAALSPEQQSKAIEAIERNASALAQLVDDLLDTSRIITGKLRLNVKDCDVTHVLEAAIESVRPALDSKELDLACDCPEGLVVRGDPDRLQQVFWNLLANSTRFTPRGGRIQLRAHNTGSVVEVMVTDSGIGIASDALPFLFERFWQAESAPSREHGGLGLGLALARHFVELHGGTISASSAGIGQGATFRVELPVASARSEPAQGGAPRTAEGEA